MGLKLHPVKGGFCTVGDSNVLVLLVVHTLTTVQQTTVYVPLPRITLSPFFDHNTNAETASFHRALMNASTFSSPGTRAK